MEMRSMSEKPIPEDSMLYKWKPATIACTENTGYAADCTTWMKEEIEAAGFVNVHGLEFKLVTGDWPSHPVWKEAGKLSAILYKVTL